MADLRRVRNKQEVLFRLARAALAHPDQTMREALYPMVGEETLRDLVAEADADEAHFRAGVRTVLRSSYSNHYRRMLPRLLETLEFRSNTARCPVLDAIALLRRYASRPRSTRHYDAAESVPLEGVVPSEWREAVVDEDGRIGRIWASTRRPDRSHRCQRNRRGQWLLCPWAHAQEHCAFPAADPLTPR